MRWIRATTQKSTRSLSQEQEFGDFLQLRNFPFERDFGGFGSFWATPFEVRTNDGATNKLALLPYSPETAIAANSSVAVGGYS
jgi:hypothetical protein